MAPQAYASMTLEFRCNLHCEHCMIEGTMDRLVPEGTASFEALLAANRAQQHWRGLILTGAEITLRRDLPDLARRARASGFAHVRIQTHGMRLADRGFLEGLIEAGIDEYFVSVAGCDAATHDRITGVPGAFAKTLAGLENLEGYPGVVSLTNSVVTQHSYRLLPAIVERLSHLRSLTQMEFWVYWPMREQDDKGLIPRHTEVLPYLKAALARCTELGRAVEVKNFPVCLLGEHGAAVINAQPNLFIDPSFWQEFMRNGFRQCVYRERCAAGECLGLNTAYVLKYGLETEVLRPLSRDPRGDRG